MKIALVGLASLDGVLIKHYFKNYSKSAPDLDIEWQERASADTDIFIFRAKFFETPVILGSLSLLPDRAKVAATYRDDEIGGKTVFHGIYIINLSNYGGSEGLKVWLDAIILGPENIQAVKQSIFQKDEQQKTNTTGGAPKGRNLFPNSQLLSTLEAGKTVVAITGGKTIFFAPKKNRVYTDFAPEDIPPFDDLFWKQGRYDDTLPLAIDLKQWLWESLWNSSINFEPYVKDNQHYCIHRWPQPRKPSNRSEPLRLCALLQRKKIAKTQSLAEISGYPPKLVKKWLYTMQLTGFSETKVVEEASEQQKMPLQENEKKEARVMMNIFKKLRKKLHLG